MRPRTRHQLQELRPEPERAQASLTQLRRRTQTLEAQLPALRATIEHLAGG